MGGGRLRDVVTRSELTVVLSGFSTNTCKFQEQKVTFQSVFLLFLTATAGNHWGISTFCCFYSQIYLLCDVWQRHTTSGGTDSNVQRIDELKITIIFNLHS